MRLLVVVAVLGLATTAFAQAPGEVPAMGSHDKDPDTAVLISVGTTAAGFVTMIAGAKAQSPGLALVGLAGLYFGPSTGQWYAGRAGGFGLGMRALGGVAVVAGAVMVMSTMDCEGSCPNETRDSNRGAALFLGGLGVWVGSSIYDFVAAHHAATRWNREHAVRVGPMIAAGAGHTTGLTLGVTF